MDFDFTDEQRLLADSVARMGREHGDFVGWRARTLAGAGMDRAAWGRMAELGWLALTVPEADGGLGGSPVDTLVVMEGLGRYLSLEPYVGAAVVAPALLPHMAEGPRARLAEAIVSGASIVALADAEPGGRFDAAHVETRAERDGDGWRLTGEKSHALDGGEADAFVLAARTGADADAISLFLVPRAAEGLEVQVSRAMDHRRNARLRLSDATVPAEALIGPEHGGLPLLQRVLDLAVVARLAEALGVMDAALAQTLEHLRTRRQFGQPIGAFQALQHRAVDMAVACEEARSITYVATLSLDADPRERRRALSAAKARVGQTGLYVGRQAVQLHGGVGFSDELAISHFLKRLISIDMCYGDAAHHRALLRAA